MSVVMTKIKISNQGDLNQDMEGNENKQWRESLGLWCKL